jgi:predicted nucleic acid-binding protein
VFLVDTSAWIEVFRKGGLALDDVAPLDEVVTCLPVIQEVLSGFRDERAYRTAKDALLSLPIVDAPMSADVFVAAADLYRAARRRGLTVRSGVDCLIAASALRHGLTVAHRDRGFDALARVAPLTVRRV